MTNAPRTLTPADAQNERELVARLRAGDGTAFETVVRTYGGRLLATARRILRDEEDARDAVQDAMVSAFRSVGSFHGESRLSTWLHRIVVNAALMKLRARARRPEVSIESLMPTFLADGHRANALPAWESPSEDRLVSRETRDAVRAAIAQLPEDSRNIVMLRDIEELDTTATAVILGISPGAVKVRLHRARMALRELLERELVGAN